MKTVSTISFLVLISVTVLSASAGNVTGWRGDGSGRYPAAKPPTEWGPEKNVIWSRKLPKWSNASPVLAGGRIFVCAEPAWLVCVDEKNGEILWSAENDVAQLFPEDKRGDLAELLQAQQELKDLSSRLKGDPQDEGLRVEHEMAVADRDIAKAGVDAVLGGSFDLSTPKAHRVNGLTSSTPVSDGKHVWVLYGTGIAACYTIDGKRKWIRFVERPRIGHGHCASPALADGMLILHIRKVHALDAASGKPRWSVPAGPRFGSPVVTRDRGRTLIVTANGEIVDAADGDVLASGLSRLTYNAPIVHDGVVFFFNNNEARAYRIPTFDVDDPIPELLWSTTVPNDRHYASPVVHGGKIFCLTQKGMLTVLDVDSGEELEKRRLPTQGTCYPSPTIAGPYIYFGGEGGNTVVLDTGDGLAEVANNILEKYRSSPLFAGSRMYLRGFSALYCIGVE